MKGINWLSCLVRYGDMAFSVGYEIIKKDILCSDLETRRQKRKASISKNELLGTLIQQAVTNRILFDCVLADNWFGSKETMKFVHKKPNKFFVLGIKSNRCVALTRQQAKSGQFQQLD